MKNTIEKNTKYILGALGFFSMLVYVINSFKLGDWSPYMYQITGIGLSLILFIEGGVITYFKKQKYQKIDVTDFVVWLTTAIAGIVFINSIMGFQIVAMRMPQAVITFVGNVSGIVGIIAGIILTIQVFTPSIN